MHTQGKEFRMSDHTVAHLRIYTINKGQMDNWLNLFWKELLPLLTKYGIKVQSTWRNEEKTQFIWIRSYGDTVNDIDKKEAAFYGSDWWKKNMGFVRSHIAHRKIKLLSLIK